MSVIIIVITIIKLVISLFEQGVHIAITMWDYDAENMFIPYDMVDEFNYEYRQSPGTRATVVINGDRKGAAKSQ